ncbi:hypothetical protein PMAYCL1PPCAC_30079, partial [Pristionchus mayeri]
DNVGQGEDVSTLIKIVVTMCDQSVMNRLSVHCLVTSSRWGPIRRLYFAPHLSNSVMSSCLWTHVKLMMTERRKRTTEKMAPTT